MVARYGFGDASGAGFGASWEARDRGVNNCYGVWGVDNDNNTSNYRELRTLVETVENMAEDEGLEREELFLFTDNPVAEVLCSKAHHPIILTSAS